MDPDKRSLFFVELTLNFLNMHGLAHSLSAPPGN